MGSSSSASECCGGNLVILPLVALVPFRLARSASLTPIRLALIGVIHDNLRSLPLRLPIFDFDSQLFEALPFETPRSKDHCCCLIERARC